MENVELPKVLGLVEASSLLELFLGKKASHISVNAENVTRIGSQCMQILLSAAKNWEEDNFDFILTNPSKEFLETMSIIGISQDDLIYHSQSIHGENRQ